MCEGVCMRAFAKLYWIVLLGSITVPVAKSLECPRKRFWNGGQMNWLLLLLLLLGCKRASQWDACFLYRGHDLAFSFGLP